MAVLGHHASPSLELGSALAAAVAAEFAVELHFRGQFYGCKLMRGPHLEDGVACESVGSTPLARLYRAWIQDHAALGRQATWSNEPLRSSTRHC